MESKKTFAPSFRGEPAGPSTARALSPAPSGRFSLRRVSQSSSRASTTCGSTCGSPSPVVTPDSSCVTRETSIGDCARYRFIAWAAVKRNSCERMTPSERLECPLLRCRQRFGDHEAMLRHLAACDHLGTCEYWCYEHMRVERFDDAKCTKRCLSQHSSKRRKMLGMAKSFFSSLGHKGRKGTDSGTLAGSDFGGGDDEPLVFVVPPPKFDLIDVDPAAGAELSGTEILEIDSIEVASIPQPSPEPPCAPAPPIRRPLPAPPVNTEAVPTVVDPQALILPELDSSTGMIAEEDAFMQWQPADANTANGPDAVSVAFVDHETEWLDAGGVSPLGSPVQRPPLQVNTYSLTQPRKIARPRPSPTPATSRSKDLSPSSSVRSTTSTTSTTSTVSNASTASATSNVSSLISPASIWSHDSNIWSDFAPHLTSPDGDLVSPGGFLPEDGAFDDSAAAFYDSTCPPPELLHSVFELPADLPQAKTVPEGPSSSDSGVFTHDVPIFSEHLEQPYAASLLLPENHLQDRLLGLPQEAMPSASSVACSFTRDSSEPQAPTSTTSTKVDPAPVASQPDARALATSAWDTLLEHIASSLIKIQHVTNNPLADQLRSLSPPLVASSGLGALRELLDGKPPTSPINTVCLVHVIYALSLVVYYNSDMSARCSQLYVQSLVYATVIPQDSRVHFNELAAAIWHPTALSRTELSQRLLRQYASLGRPPSHRGAERSDNIYRHIPYQEDPMICTARTFLDELECSAVLGSNPESLEVVTSDLYTQHIRESALAAGPSITLTAAARFVTKQLEKRFGSSGGLLDLLKDICARVGSGSISSLRRVELELLRAGKMSLPSRVYCDEFTSTLGHLCDHLYQKNGRGVSQRAAYHRHSIALFEAIIAELDSTRAAAAAILQTPTTDEVLLDNFLTSISPSIANHPAEGLLLPFDLDAVTTSFPGLGATTETLTLKAEPAVTRPGSLKQGESVVEQDLPAVQHSASTSAGPTSSSSSSITSPSSSSPDSAPSTTSSSSLARTEANDCCDICGYRPKGDPQWFKGSMAKHKKLQHSTEPPKIYKCPFLGCTSQYKNRPDNLRQHQIEKKHFVDGEEPHRRPSKRKKISE